LYGMTVKYLDRAIRFVNDFKTCAEQANARAEHAEADEKALREALAKIAEKEQSRAYRGAENELQDALNLTHALRECGDIARAALAQPEEERTRK